MGSAIAVAGIVFLWRSRSQGSSKGGSRAKLDNIRRRDRSALTIVELLVSISVIGILIGLAIPAVIKGREAARKAQCRNNLHQIGLALHIHHEERLRFPAGVTWRDRSMRLVSWQVRVYPYLGRRALWTTAVEDYAESSSPFGPIPHAGFSRPVKVFSCPSDGRSETPHMSRSRFYVALTDYLGVLGTDVSSQNGMLYADSKIRIAQVRDGTSHTVIVGERPPSKDYYWGWLYAGAGFDRGSGDMILGLKEFNNGRDLLATCSMRRGMFQASSLDRPCHMLHFWSMHVGGAFFLYVDGSVRFHSYGDRASLVRAATRNIRGSHR